MHPHNRPAYGSASSLSAAARVLLLTPPCRVPCCPPPTGAVELDPETGLPTIIYTGEWPAETLPGLLDRTWLPGPAGLTIDCSADHTTAIRT